MSTNAKWESIPEIRERTGKNHDEAVAMIREGMRNKTCRCRPDVGPYGQVPLFQFDELANAEAEIEADTDRNFAKSSMFDSFEVRS